ncbi:hypothetical protein [Archangium sp.]|uniref:hypothetical protein n=1 Tax=Archangium sp. TaxID=1872627 RepID=UPI002ED8ACD8
MDTEKKPESNGEHPEQVGPYRIQEQVPQPKYPQGDLYRAIHETSGAMALVLKPAEDGSVPLKDWRVRCISSASPGYLAMEVEHTPWSVSQDRHSVESLVFTLEEVRAGVRHMAHALSPEPEPHEPNPWQRLGLVLTGATGVCALLFALVLLRAVSQPPSAPEPLASAPPAPISHEVPATAETSDFDAWLADTTAGGQTVLARPLPKEPFKGQKRPPCTRYTEVELIGACWAPHKLKAPCPETLFEYQGECYIPAFSAKPPPQSLGQ